MDLNYKGRRSLIVGGSYGIGKASAALMTAEGAEVIIASRNIDNLTQAAADIEAEYGVTPAPLACDITLPEASELLSEEVKTRWGALDVLVTAVGGSKRSAFADLSDDDSLDQELVTATRKGSISGHHYAWGSRVEDALSTSGRY